MVEICPKCGLPKDICVCDVLDKETENSIKVYTKKAKFDKVMTVVEGIPPADIENVSKNLKRVLGCGGTYKDNTIELQGYHKLDVKKALADLGYNDQNIEVI
jgi:translation initiation factor 1